MRGEDARPYFVLGTDGETPPHAWGRRYPRPDLVSIIGNTPTCVGKTTAQARVRHTVRKHPHMRGEDLFAGKTGESVLETPPHAWGRPLPPFRTQRRIQKHPHMRGEDRDDRAVNLRFHRNTPTCVGKTRLSLGSGLLRKKHPHMRGEDPNSFARTFCGAETPPHAWGRHRHVLLQLSR